MDYSAVFLAFVLAILSGCREAPLRPSDSPERIVASDGIGLHVWSSPGPGSSAEPLILLSGGPGAAHGYLSPLTRLGRRLPVVLYDQRGTGRSIAPASAGFRASDHVRDLESIRQALSAPRLHLLGHSWGGSLALAYAAAYPDRVASLVLVADFPPLSGAAPRAAHRLRQRINEALGGRPFPESCAAQLEAGFKDKKLSQNQMRLLAMARQQEGRFTSAQYQKLVGSDIYAASQDIKELIRKGLVRLEKKGGRLYRLAQEGRGAPPEDFNRVAGELAAKKRLSNGDLRRIWEADRQSALRRAQRLIEEGWLRATGAGRGSRYVAGPKAA